ncbi:zinc-ribbon domain-containing protein [Candidatus Parcubacteria bacterium]|nr:zinc-ribbon domain-containing protein [Candidatus Parcubacteria bacterium]
MFCENCGNKIAKDSKFCPSCGVGLEKTEVIKNTQENTEVVSTVKDKTSIFNSIISVISFIAAFIIGRFLGFVVVFLFIGAWALGEWFPKWYMKRRKVNTILVKWIVWSNILTWLLPPLGVLTSFATLRFGDYFPSENEKYKTIATIALTASILNAISGILINL